MIMTKRLERSRKNVNARYAALAVFLRLLTAFDTGFAAAFFFASQ
jgi:hypothetical protein